MVVYPAVFKKDGKYTSVTFPDVPEAMTQGENLEEAFQMAEEVVGFALEDYKTMPKVSAMDTLKEKYPDDFIALIKIDMKKYLKKYYSGTVRKNVTVPEYLAVMAKDDHLNMSKFLTESLERKYSL
ncbi:type II toxin-antitoxin system HicB family antitoxin [Lactococcus fujiensis]|nr:type II toxin-antitoxin system HicB family antitoxin [Lactococcus fujiensis]